MTEPLSFKTVDEAIEIYVDTRDALRLHMKKAKEKEEELKELMDKISTWLRDKADEIGVESFRTKHGTAYRNVKQTYRIRDWDAFVEFIKETDNFQLLEKRVGKRAAAEVHQHNVALNKEHENDEEYTPIDEIPAGLDYIVEVEFNVLRPGKKATDID